MSSKLRRAGSSRYAFHDSIPSPVSGHGIGPPRDPVPFFWSKSLMSSAALLGAPAGPSARSTWNGVAPQRGRPWCTSSGESRFERQYRVGRDTTVSRGSERGERERESVRILRWGGLGER